MIKFEEAIKNKDYLKICNSILKNLKIRKEEKDQLIHIAIWTACRDFDSEKSKFTTYLYNTCRFQYLKLINYNIKHKHVDISKIKEKTIGDTSSDLIDVFDLLSQNEQEIISDRFIHKMSLNTIAKKHGVKIPEVKNRIENIKTKLESYL
jgi:RNA polymerase sigma factor (sigma-70 family)